MEKGQKIALALGSGSARGWAHIGVINALAEMNIVPDIICGTSVGSLVGASYAAQNLQKLEHWVCSLSKYKTIRFFDIDSSLSGFVDTERFHQFLNEYVVSDDVLIEDLGCRYTSVATDLQNGREKWMGKGPLIEAVWASISLPGLFPAIRHQDRWLVDGGLVNPVPVSVCRALGADLVIAVNLNGDIVGKHFEEPEPPPKPKEDRKESITDRVIEYTSALFESDSNEIEPPSLFDAIAGSVNIIQDRITRSRLAGDPPDIQLSPKLGDIGLLEFYRGKQAIQEGRNSVIRMQHEIKHVLGIK